MPCRELRFCLWYFMWSTKIRKTVFVQKVAEIKRKHPKSEDFRCCFGAAGRIRTADLILTNHRRAFQPLLYKALRRFFVQKG